MLEKKIGSVLYKCGCYAIGVFLRIIVSSKSLIRPIYDVIKRVATFESLIRKLGSVEITVYYFFCILIFCEIIIMGMPPYFSNSMPYILVSYLIADVIAYYVTTSH